VIPLSRPIIGAEEQEAVARVLASGMLAAGPEVEAFEHEFAAYCGVGHAIAVANGTVALQLGLWALGVGAGDEVVIPSFTFAATANAVRMVGAVPVFADIDPASFCITRETVEPVMTSRTAAIMPVHLYGHMANMPGLKELAATSGVAVVEDAAQAHGARYGNRTAGSMGAFGALSFYPTKNMTTGEGGIITTNDPELAAQARLIRNHGMQRRYYHDILGTNARMTDIAAAIGRVQLRHLDGWTKQRRANAETYRRLLSDTVQVPTEAADTVHVYHQYTIRTESRDAMIARFQEASIGHGIYYPVPCHRQPYLAVDEPADLPETDRAAAEVLSIPVRPDLADVELDAVAAAVKGTL
jgi:dTDP-4-amino-4,6-dideoxygalactose transaminase